MATKYRKAVQQYLASIGSRGGKARAARHDAATLSKWGKLGGRPPKKKKKEASK